MMRTLSPTAGSFSVLLPALFEDVLREGRGGVGRACGRPWRALCVRGLRACVGFAFPCVRVLEEEGRRCVFCVFCVPDGRRRGEEDAVEGVLLGEAFRCGAFFATLRLPWEDVLLSDVCVFRAEVFF